MENLVWTDGLIPEFSMVCTFIPTPEQVSELKRVAGVYFPTTNIKHDIGEKWHICVICLPNPTDQDMGRAETVCGSYEELVKHLEETGGDYSSGSLSFTPFRFRTSKS